MKPRTLLVLLVLVVALGLFIGLYERKLPSSTERAERARKVVPFGKEEIVGLTLESAGGTVSLERAPAKASAKGAEKKGEMAAESAPAAADWSLTRPLRAHADSFAVDRLLDTLTGLERTRTLEAVDRAAVGLDHPRATIRFRTKEGEKVLRLGADVPTGGSLIAGLEGRDEAYVVASAILTEVAKPADDWRDKQLFHGDREAIERITLRSGDAPPVVLVQGPKGFEIQQPLRDRADRDAVEALIADLTGLSAERFVSGRPATELGLAPAATSVEVSLRGAPPVRIELGHDIVEAAQPGSPSEAGGANGAAKLVYLKVGDALAEARTGLAGEAGRAPDSWRSRALSSFEVHQIESASVLGSGPALELTRSGTDWKRGGTTISYLPVSDLLFALSNARADRLLTPVEAVGTVAGSAKPAFTFKLRSKEAGEETLTLYAATPQGVPARVSDRQGLLLLPVEILKQIEEKLAEIRGAKPAPPEKGR